MRENKKVAVYVRVSTLDQQKGLDSQEKALNDYLRNNSLEAEWYRDKVSGSTIDRPAFKRLQHDIFRGQMKTVICWKLDRLSRSLKDGINVLVNWLEKDVRVVAVAQDIDFSGTAGQMVASILFAVGQIERENLRENTKRGLVAAKAKGIKLGRHPELFAKDIQPLRDSGMSIAEVAAHLNKTRQAIYNALKRDSAISLTKGGSRHVTANKSTN